MQTSSFRPTPHFLRRALQGAGLVLVLMLALLGTTPAAAGTTGPDAGPDGLRELAESLIGHPERVRALQPTMAESLAIAASTGDAVRMYFHAAAAFRNMPDDAVRPPEGDWKVLSQIVAKPDSEDAQAYRPYVKAGMVLGTDVDQHLVHYTGTSSTRTYGSFFYVNGRWIMIPMFARVPQEASEYEVEKAFLLLLKVGRFEEAYAMMSARVHETTTYETLEREFRALFASEIESVDWHGHEWRGNRYGKSQTEVRGTLTYKDGAQADLLMGLVFESGQVRVAHVERHSAIGVPLTVAVTPSRARSIELAKDALTRLNNYFVSKDYAALAKQIVGEHLTEANIARRFAMHLQPGLHFTHLEDAEFSLREEPIVEHDDTANEMLVIRCDVVNPTSRRRFHIAVAFRFDGFKEELRLYDIAIGDIDYAGPRGAEPKVDDKLVRSLADGAYAELRKALATNGFAELRPTWSTLLQETLTDEAIRNLLAKADRLGVLRAVARGDELDTVEHEVRAPGVLGIEARQPVSTGLFVQWSLVYVFEADGTWKLAGFNLELTKA
ncbi:MAG: hypothetical protein QNJ98_17555 [Planctomycetota bacterium]|nr:hypothetical protein [Planctomycetota bacterium]